MYRYHSILFLVFVFTIFYQSARAQERKVAPTSQELFDQVAKLDSTLFAAFNTQDMDKFKALFTEDLEWFQDNGGLLSYQTVFTNFGNMFRQENKLTRELMPGSLEVHPIKDYGAIEIGSHRFRHFENGKEETGTFRFLMIWHNENGQWRISRVVSYDH